MLQALNPLDATSLLTALGAVGVFMVLFAETGLLVGFFLPGDSLLVTAGLLCTTGGSGAVHLALPGVLAAVSGGLLGAQLDHGLGRRAGRPLPGCARNRYVIGGVARAEELLGRYGHGKATMACRLIRVVRTVLDPVAGTVRVPARTFALWQVRGGPVWTVGLVLGGYVLGSTVPDVGHHLLPLVAAIVAVSPLPLALEVLRAHRHRTATEPARETTA
ncbi:DedA family protein [Streptomyces sp900116325]|uniref:DedA family protein n=1 Tax=Streptomyces sp. 900116325 TaxID=3154295 RepID=UPI00331FE5EC